MHTRSDGNGGNGDAERLARLGLGCLSNAAAAAMATTEVVCDGPYMFLVPRKDLQAGEEVTHVYNWEALASDDDVTMTAMT